MKSLNEKKRLRRVILLCCHFVRNLTYYRAWHNKLTGGNNSQILVTIDGNFLDMAVIEWCKLFADKRGKHYWGKVVSYQNFEFDMLSHLGMTIEEFEIYVDELRHYRDKFLAHLDDEDTMNIPWMDQAMKAVQFFHDHLVNRVASNGDLDGLPTNLPGYYSQCSIEVLAMLDRCDL